MTKPLSLPDPQSRGTRGAYDQDRVYEAVAEHGTVEKLGSSAPCVERVRKQGQAHRVLGFGSTQSTASKGLLDRGTAASTKNHAKRGRTQSLGSPLSPSPLSTRHKCASQSSRRRSFSSHLIVVIQITAVREEQSYDHKMRRIPWHGEVDHSLGQQIRCRRECSRGSGGTMAMEMLHRGGSDMDTKQVAGAWIAAVVVLSLCLGGLSHFSESYEPEGAGA
jgi:hypothetical protein